jgi:hypothetical protein
MGLAAVNSEDSLLSPHHHPLASLALLLLPLLLDSKG